MRPATAIEYPGNDEPHVLTRAFYVDVFTYHALEGNPPLARQRC